MKSDQEITATTDEWLGKRTNRMANGGQQAWEDFKASAERMFMSSRKRKGEVESSGGAGSDPITTTNEPTLYAPWSR